MRLGILLGFTPNFPLIVSEYFIIIVCMAEDIRVGGTIKILIKAEEDDIWREALKPLRRLERSISIVFATKSAEIESAIRDADIIIGGNWREEHLELAEKVKLIQFYWAGVERINFDLLKRRKILLSNTHENRHAVAEYTWALILSMVKRLNHRERLLKEGRWLRGYKRELMNVEVRGKALGILGLGSIGLEVARLGRAFGMRVIGTKRRPAVKNWPGTEIVEKVYPPEETRKVCLESDVTVVVLPLTGETRGLLGWAVLKDMKGRYLVNVSRGAVIEEEALYRALKEGILAGAAIDTWYNYPRHYGDLDEVVYPSNFPFHELDNVVMSPHIAGFSVEGHVRNTSEAVKNVINFIEGKKLENVVDLDAGY